MATENATIEIEPRGKLTPQNIEEIRSLWVKGGISKSALGEKFDVSRTYIARLVNNLKQEKDGSGGNGKGELRQEKPGTSNVLGSQIRYNQKLSLGVVIDMFYEAARKLGWQGSKEDFILECVSGYFRMRGYEFILAEVTNG